ncbi:putative lipid transport family protein [Blattamonas nauphoetae]|uniref:Lipid transport family protein n=1 Tax=Blattamonas nauphoetae TaxID=2049346 RepID=A0ABQ9YEH5_9EUKA|nr:putative lipid transport family protein [Blattamonas nauphoetae]
MLELWGDQTEMIQFFIISAFASSLRYQVGNTYEYDYVSDNKIKATNSAGLEKFQGFRTTAKLHFTCTAFNSNRYIFELTASSVHIYNDENGKQTKIDHPSDNLETIFARPLVFTLSHTGTIEEASAHKDDSEDVVNVKTAMAETLSAHFDENSNSAEHLVIDTQGKHYTHIEYTQSGSGYIADAFYRESDFINFRDSAADESGVIVDGSSQTTFSNGIVKTVKSSVVYNFASDPNGAEIEQGRVDMMTEGTVESTLKSVNSAQRMLASPDVPFQTLIGRYYQNNVVLPFYSSSFYESRDSFAHIPEIDQGGHAGEIECPSALNLCKGYEAGYSVGNSSFGLTAHAQVMAGTNKGCDNDARNYFAGAEATVDLFILGKKYSALETHIEYGYMYGSAARNNIEVNIFDKNVYRKTFPDMPCVRSNINLANIHKSFPLKYTVHVYSLPVTFELAVDLGFTANVPYKYCLTDMSADISIVPTGTFAAFASVRTSLVVVKGGIKFTASVSETLDPMAWISGGKCSLGIKAASHTSPLACEFYGFYQIRTLKKPFKWNAEKKYTFWKWSSKAIDYVLFDYKWGIQ